MKIKILEVKKPIPIFGQYHRVYAEVDGKRMKFSVYIGALETEGRLRSEIEEQIRRKYLDLSFYRGNGMGNKR